MRIPDPGFCGMCACARACMANGTPFVMSGVLFTIAPTSKPGTACLFSFNWFCFLILGFDLHLVCKHLLHGATVFFGHPALLVKSWTDHGLPVSNLCINKMPDVSILRFSRYVSNILLLLLSLPISNGKARLSLVQTLPLSLQLTHTLEPRPKPDKVVGKGSERLAFGPNGWQLNADQAKLMLLILSRMAHQNARVAGKACNMAVRCGVCCGCPHQESDTGLSRSAWKYVPAPLSCLILTYTEAVRRCITIIMPLDSPASFSLLFCSFLYTILGIPVHRSPTTLLRASLLFSFFFAASDHALLSCPTGLAAYILFGKIQYLPIYIRPSIRSGS